MLLEFDLAEWSTLLMLLREDVREDVDDKELEFDAGLDIDAFVVFLYWIGEDVLMEVTEVGLSLPFEVRDEREVWNATRELLGGLFAFDDKFDFETGVEVVNLATVTLEVDNLTTETNFRWIGFVDVLWTSFLVSPRSRLSTENIILTSNVWIKRDFSVK